MLSSRDAALRLGSRIVAGYNLWMLVAFAGGILSLGVIEQWFFAPSTTIQTAQNSSTVVYKEDDMANMQSKNPILIAYTLEKHLKTGYLHYLNDYDLNDPIFQPAITQWKKECGVICSWDLPAGHLDTGHGLISCDPTSQYCSQGLQCAAFVYTVFQLAGKTLPAGGNAIDYWGEAPYYTQNGWKEFYNGSDIPQPGDLAVWNGDPYSPLGHIAIVVNVQLPQGESNGKVLLAQANGLGNVTVGGANLLSAPLFANTHKVGVWGWNAPASGWNGFQFTGFIHNTSVQYENLTSALAQAELGSSIPGSSGGYNVVGSPTLTADQINTVLANAKSPAAGTGQSLYDLGVQSNIDPVFALAFFLEESSFGKAGLGAINHSLGNIRCTSPDQQCYQGFVAYPNWPQGYAAWYQLIKGSLYVGAKPTSLTTVEQIVPRYAPGNDNNDVAGYIKNVETAVKEWRSGNLSYV